MTSRILDVREMKLLATLDDRFRPTAEKVLDAVNVACAEHACHVFLDETSCRRDAEQQMKLWKVGRTLKHPDRDPKLRSSWTRVPGASAKTNAFPDGESPHEYGLAIDIALLSDRDNTWLKGGANWDPLWGMLVGAIGEAHGLVWGGRFRWGFDGAHLEHPSWAAIAAEMGFAR